CGTGDHEIAAAQYRMASQIDAFDFSNASVKLASQKAAEAKVKINFYTDDLNTFTLPKGVRYDLALCSGSLHHTREIERFLATIRDSLSSDGVFIINEYVGACYNLYEPRQLELINRI